ncbi:hypothetical protein C7377_0494 [Balneicella halophila]|uniref:HD domain-containing protein n=1 Tax=Balneicella halophila TaxID=1537566 RepID=A0A7L4UR13_BALHA|nr:HDIG domain-containing metalloprotein [Balneicella halophila]PVX52190.1 hypothetical protein C7377_0494 [Balneicella halophila]
MKYGRNTPHTKFRRGMAVSLFLLTLLIILLLYPNIKHFRYSYQAGKPWQYETLYAPFQFPVRKSVEQIASEKEQLLASSVPYYRYESATGEKQIIEAKKDAQLHTKQIDFLKNIYAQPILALDSLATKSESVFIIKDHISTKMDVSEVRTITSVLNLIDQQAFSEEEKAAMRKYIAPNLRFDKQQTEALNNVDNISAYMGEVQANELIISRGEIVTPRTYLILESLKSQYSKLVGKTSNIGYVLLGQFLFVALCLSFLYLFLRNYRVRLLDKPLELSFILLSIIVSVALTRALLYFGRFEILLIPYTLLAVIIRTFIDSRTALFTFLATILICSFIVPQGYEFVTMHFITGTIAVLYLKQLDRRSQLLSTALIVFCSYTIIYLAIYTTGEGKIETLNPMIFVRLGLNAIFLTVAYPLLYLLEKTFKFLSDVTLIELSNTNNKLLRELSQVAPGTFQHSMQMANLAEEAVRKLEGNPLLVRAGALYHDIGKMENPMYFTENQYGDISPHSKLSNEESAQIIINHVTDGIKMAKKHNLPSQLIDFIATHHGKGKTEYFYRSYIKENPDEEVNPSYFSYPGPDPFTKEQAILMMADACEAATRSLKKKNETNISKMVSDIIDFQKSEGRFDNAPITFAEIELTKKIFIKKLTDIYHSRIAYPEKTEAE